MITTITRYPPTSAERLCTFAGGVIATLLLAAGAFLIMESSTLPGASHDRARTSAPVAGNYIVLTAVAGGQ